MHLPSADMTPAQRRIVNDARNAREAAVREQRDHEAREQRIQDVDAATAYERLGLQMRIRPTLQSFLPGQVTSTNMTCSLPVFPQ